MESQREYKLGLDQINKLKQIKINLLKQEDYIKEKIRKQKEELRALLMDDLLEKFNENILSTPSHDSYMDLNRFECHRKETASLIFERHFKGRGLSYDTNEMGIKVSNLNTSILVSYEDVFKLFAKFCYHTNFTFDAVISDQQQRFLINTAKPFNSSSWNNIPIVIENEKVILKCFNQDQVLFSLN